MTPPSGLQILRNFENAAKKAGGTIEGQWPGWCKAMYDVERMPRMGNGCTSFALTMKFVKGDKETWVFLQAAESDGSYQMTLSEREAMKQEVAVNELADRLNKDGFVSLDVNFDTGLATIRPDSAKTLDDAAAALKTMPAMKIEVGGHTDNVGTPEANQKLSQERAQAVMAALVQRGITADRMTAKGYGQSTPVADNRTEEGRAKNRRVELVGSRRAGSGLGPAPGAPASPPWLCSWRPQPPPGEISSTLFRSKASRQPETGLSSPGSAVTGMQMLTVDSLFLIQQRATRLSGRAPRGRAPRRARASAGSSR